MIDRSIDWRPLCHSTSPLAAWAARPLVGERTEESRQDRSCALAAAEHVQVHRSTLPYCVEDSHLPTTTTTTITALLLLLQVQDVVSDVLRAAGIATSRYAARLFRPAGTTAAAKGSSRKETQQRHQDSKTSAADQPQAYAPTAAAPAAPAALDDNKTKDPDNLVSAAASGFWYSDSCEGSADLESLQYNLGEVGGALLSDDDVITEITDEQWLALIQRNSSPDRKPVSSAEHGSSCPMPQLQVSSLRPRLAEANMLLGAAGVEPQWLRGFGVWGSGHWFDTGAWAKVIQTLLLLLTRCALRVQGWSAARV